MGDKLDRMLELLESDGASPRKRRRGNNHEGGTIASAPVAAAAAAQGVETEVQAAAVNAMSVLMASHKPDDPYSSSAHLRDATLRQLLKTVVDSRIAWRSKDRNVFGSKVERGLKSRVVIMLEVIHDSSEGALVPEPCYTAEQEPYLSGTNVPADKTSGQYSDYLEYRSRIFASVEKKFMLYLARNYNATLDQFKALVDAAADDDDLKKKQVANSKQYSAGDYGCVDGKTLLKSTVGVLSSTVETLKMMKKEIQKNART